MVKIRRLLVVLIAALPVTVAAGGTHATASAPSYGGTSATGTAYVGPEEGIRANERYPQGAAAF
jgi:hypothetical protein